MIKGPIWIFFVFEIFIWEIGRFVYSWKCGFKLVENATVGIEFVFWPSLKRIGMFASFIHSFVCLFVYSCVCECIITMSTYFCECIAKELHTKIKAVNEKWKKSTEQYTKQHHTSAPPCSMIMGRKTCGFYCIQTKHNKII